MNVFEEIDGKINIHPEAYVLKPFKDIWNVKNKEKAKKELAFIYFFCDFKSDFADIVNENDKTEEIKKVVDLPDNWKMNDKIKDAIKFYKERQKTPSMHLLDSALQFTEKLKNFYEDIDLLERDPKTNKLLHNVPQLQKGIAELSEQTESLKKLKNSVAREIEEESRIRGGGEIGYFEDPDE